MTDMKLGLDVASAKNAARLAALRELKILDTPPELVLDRLTALAARLLGVPVVLVDLVDDRRIWAKAHFGTDVSEYPLLPGFCASAVLQDAPFVIDDASTDPRSAGHPLVQGENGVRFYAGVPLKTQDNHNIGTFCIIDFKPRSLSPAQLQMLEDLAFIAMHWIALGAKANRIDENADIQAKFKLTELQNQLILNSAAEGIHVIDLNGTVIVENAAAVHLLGWEQGGLLGKPAHATIHHHRADRSVYPQSKCPIYKTLEDGISRHVSDEVFWRKDGSCFPVEYSTSALRDLDGKLYGTTIVFRDIAARKAVEENVQRLAYYDMLTGLPNRSLFIDRLEQELIKTQRRRQRMALMFIDLDNFKEINDTLGHQIGDQLLVEAALRLNGCVRGSDTVARLGGDEFTVIQAEIHVPADAERAAQCILKQMARPFVLEGETIYLSASIGITVFPDDAATTDELIRNADQAMYAAKKAGRNRYQYFTASMQENAQSRLRLLADLHGGLERQEFFLVYQPIVELASGKVRKAEALLRWRHPQRGMVSPAEFIPVAEKSGLIVAIGQWVFEQAAAEIKRLRQWHIEDFQISVNKSPVQFNAMEDVHSDWFVHLKAAGLGGENICVEITEGLLLDASASVQEKLLAFSEAGMQVALDDFGTGYSSLSYLKKFSIDYLKIDQSFVQNLSPDADDYALCEAIIVMAHKLNIEVIAEEVETEQQYRLLLDAGCDYGQGYYFSRPLSQQDFEQYLLQEN